MEQKARDRALQDKEMMDRKKYFRSIPKVDELLKEEKIRSLCRLYGRGIVLDAVRKELEGLRGLVQTGEEEEIRFSLNHFRDSLPERIQEEVRLPLKRVFNGTGILLHTNLGRAPLGETQIRAALAVMGGYSNLEYDLEEGKRGKRSSHFSGLVQRVTGAEAAIAVNNNAAAVTLILSALAQGREVIVSRGELIEIGGRFRIPEVMEQSGAILRETGTTNRTRLSDYEKALCPETGALLKVHTSNYRILGFTEEVSVEELAGLGREHELPVIVDLGSGVLVELEKYGLAHEPTVQETLKKGADLVCFSGDKLLGGVQAGIIAGKKKYIEQMEQHPLMRAFRLDKCSIAVLCATFQEYLDPERAEKHIPVLRMLSRTPEELREQAERMKAQLEETLPEQKEKGSLDPEKAQEKGAFSGEKTPGMAEMGGSLSECWEIRTEPCLSQVGGGSLPGEEFPGFALTVKPRFGSCEELAAGFRKCEIPVIGYVKNDRFWLDMRTILPEETDEVCREIKKTLEDLFLADACGNRTHPGRD